MDNREFVLLGSVIVLVFAVFTLLARDQSEDFTKSLWLLFPRLFAVFILVPIIIGVPFIALVVVAGEFGWIPVMVTAGIGGLVGWVIWSEWWLLGTQRFILRLLRENNGKIAMSNIWRVEHNSRFERYHDIAVHLLRLHGKIDVRRMHYRGEDSHPQARVYWIRPGETTNTREPFCLTGADPSVVRQYKELQLCSECDREAILLHRERRWNLIVGPTIGIPKCVLHQQPKPVDETYRRSIQEKTLSLTSWLDQDPMVTSPELRRWFEKYCDEARLDFDTDAGTVKLMEHDRLFWRRPHLYLSLEPPSETPATLKPYRPTWLTWECMSFEASGTTLLLHSVDPAIWSHPLRMMLMEETP